ncbi:hypothetical protein [Thermodesulfovibrio thiophilus]|uniref:hypothetical protein n=1 Tax=Thermodesulfovibrio thiophilus TaxID=340095 RepID=UPI00183F9276|nr:hypothetical protein [Thermodesulfovibrio thiophilus]HHW19968.1 hypothetical protein [Thermodesulfovibrio thiophilus]
MLYEIIFSKTVLKCKNKLYDFAVLTGLLLSTVKNAIKELVMNGFVRIVDTIIQDLPMSTHLI